MWCTNDTGRYNFRVLYKHHVRNEWNTLQLYEFGQRSVQIRISRICLIRSQVTIVYIFFFEIPIEQIILQKISIKVSKSTNFLKLFFQYISYPIRMVFFFYGLISIFFFLYVIVLCFTQGAIHPMQDKKKIRCSSRWGACCSDCTLTLLFYHVHPPLTKVVLYIFSLMHVYNNLLVKL